MGKLVLCLVGLPYMLHPRSSIFYKISSSCFVKSTTIVLSFLRSEFVSNNSYYFCHDPTIALKIFDDFKRDGYPSSVAGYEVESIRYLGEPGYDSLTADKKPKLATSKSSPMLTLRFKNGCVVQLRASGTEPKFKYYIEMRGEPGVSRDEVEKELVQMSRLVLEDICQPEQNGLVVP